MKSFIIGSILTKHLHIAFGNIPCFTNQVHASTTQLCLQEGVWTTYNVKGIILQSFIQEWSYIPVGGSLPNTEQKNLAFGAAASMVHPATGYKIDE